MYREESNRRESIIAFFDAFASNFRVSHSRPLTEINLRKMQEKNARIKALSEEVEFLKSQLAIKDQQIDTANRLADQAQKLNLADKPQLMHKDSDETSSEKLDSDKKTTKRLLPLR